MHVAEEGGQLRQMDVYVGIAAIPVQKSANCEAVSQIVDAGSTTSAAKWAQTSLIRGFTEPFPRDLVSQTDSSFPKEEA
jgi:hypothetical protein